MAIIDTEQQPEQSLEQNLDQQPEQAVKPTFKIVDYGDVYSLVVVVGGIEHESEAVPYGEPVLFTVPDMKRQFLAYMDQDLVRNELFTPLESHVYEVSGGSDAEIEEQEDEDEDGDGDQGGEILLEAVPDADSAPELVPLVQPVPLVPSPPPEDEIVKPLSKL